jgi:hypothetical protein
MAKLKIYSGVATMGKLITSLCCFRNDGCFMCGFLKEIYHILEISFSWFDELLFKSEQAADVFLKL